MNKQLTEISKFLSYVLRHKPDRIGLTLDHEGWADITSLITQAEHAGTPLSLPLIHQVVESNDKKRFTLSSDGLRIRAAQGHSNATVAIDYPEQTPPGFLYHGTATRFLQSISAEGLRAGQRHYVHLSADIETATNVGLRHGKPAILQVNATAMQQQGFKFFQAENGVWLTANVPTTFFMVLSPDPKNQTLNNNN